MNVTVLMIAAYLPLIPILYLVIKSGAFGKGSIVTLLKLFFLGVAAAVPAFLMEAGVLLAVTVLLRIIQDGEYSGAFLLLSCILRYLLATALIEEGWKFFVLHSLTWKQMTMEKIGDGTAAAAVVGTGFSAVMFAAWQAAWHVVPADMVTIRQAMPEFLHAGAVISFLFALFYVPSHFGYSGFMGSLYGVAKGSDQKNHGARAGFMLMVSLVMPILVHSLCMVLVSYGIAGESLLWTVLGLAAEMALAIAAGMSLAGPKKGEEPDAEEEPVDFADSEEFAQFAEAAGNEDGSLAGAAGNECEALAETAENEGGFQTEDEGGSLTEEAGNEVAPLAGAAENEGTSLFLAEEESDSAESGAGEDDPSEDTAPENSAADDELFPGESLLGFSEADDL